MTRPLYPPEAWPRLMPAALAAGYCGEGSVESFRRKVGVLYPRPVTPKGSRQRWLREDLDKAILALAGNPEDMTTFDAASVL
jgi:hypothetical protein